MPLRSQCVAAAPGTGRTVRLHPQEALLQQGPRALQQSEAFSGYRERQVVVEHRLGLHRLTAQQSADLYELILNRHRVSRFVVTSNRAVEEWLSLFDDPILGNSALDRLANASYEIVIEGSSYRERLSPHRALLEAKRVIDQPTAT